jgi:hypothetical protein
VTAWLRTDDSHPPGNVSHGWCATMEVVRCLGHPTSGGAQCWHPPRESDMPFSCPWSLHRWRPGDPPSGPSYDWVVWWVEGSGCRLRIGVDSQGRLIRLLEGVEWEWSSQDPLQGSPIRPGTRQPAPKNGAL